MSTLPQRMREAADTLEEWSARQGYGSPAGIEWNAKDLRTEAEHLEAELDQVEKLAIDLRAARLDHSVLNGWDGADEGAKVIYRQQAAKLLEQGWIKV